MDIAFRTNKLQKTFNSEKLLVTQFGSEDARIIMRRMTVLRAATNLSEVSSRKPERRHQLEGDKQGQFAIDLKHPFRLIFEPNHNPLPIDEEGNTDIIRVTAIKILQVEDYH